MATVAGVKFLDPQGPTLNWISLMLCVISISMDPLFFYIPVIKLDKNCVDFDKELVVISSVLRSTIDVFYIICTCYRLRTNTSAPRRYLMTFLDILAVLPLPQAMIIIIISETSLLNILEALMNVLKYYVFFQFMPRVIRIYPLFKQATSTRIPVEVTWAKAVFNLYLYSIFGHVIGALWYFFAIQRMIDCWKKACIVMNQTRCNHQSFICHKSLEINRFLNDGCSTKSQNTNFYDFGIYFVALQNGIVERRYLQRFMFCFRWGLQSLSGLAQNLEPSTDIWENIFTISITISSVVLFVFLIGHMQLYMQSETTGSEEKKRKLREIEKGWKTFEKLPQNLQQQMWDHNQNSGGVDVENFLNKLSKNLHNKIICELFLPLLKGEPNFGSLPDQLLKALCKRLKPVQYAAGANIVDEDDEIEEMYIFTVGELFTTKSSENNAQVLLPNEFCGEELYSWARESSSEDQLPISNTTITARTKVEAFSIKANEIKDVFNQFGLRHDVRLGEALQA